jgi:hypothetical protein
VLFRSEENDFHVYNCNPDSELEVFPFIDFDEAVSISLENFPNVETERAEGMYDRFDAEEKKKKDKKKMNQIEKIKKSEKPIEGSKGVIYYNVGRGSLVRLAVSISTCVKHYPKEQITILADYEGYDDCKKMAEHFGVNVKLIELETLDKKEILLNKCLAHTYTPYDNTIFIDADTIILNSFDELHDAADEDEFVVTQFSDWTTKRSVIRKRIKEWKPIFPEMMKEALEQKRAESHVTIFYLYISKNGRNHVLVHIGLNSSISSSRLVLVFVVISCVFYDYFMYSTVVH